MLGAARSSSDSMVVLKTSCGKALSFISRLLVLLGGMQGSTMVNYGGSQDTVGDRTLMTHTMVWGRCGMFGEKRV